MGNNNVQELENIVDYAEKNSENKLSTYEKIVDPIAATGAGILNSAASLPSLPEELINLLRLGKHKAGQKLGLIDKDSQNTRDDIPLAPSYEQMMNLSKKDAKYFKTYNAKGDCFFVKLKTKNSVEFESKALNYISKRDAENNSFYPRIVTTNMGDFNYIIYVMLLNLI